MTYDQFLARLRETPRDWLIWVHKIRRLNHNKRAYECPLCSLGSGFALAWLSACGQRRAEDRALELLAQRDELLTVLKVFVDEYLGAQYERGMWPLMDQAMDAIAKAEGK
jgi:hypothetical protein